MTGHEDWIVCLAATPDGSLLASGDRKGILRLWNLPAGTPRATIDTGGGMVRCLEVAPGGSVLAAGGQDGRVRFYALPSAEFLAEVDATEAGTEGVVDLAFDPGGTRLATACNRGLMKWDFAAERLGTIFGRTSSSGEESSPGVDVEGTLKAAISALS
jgi:WD40 repeat protein